MKFAIISSDDEQTTTNEKISSLDALTQTSSDEDQELNQLIKEAHAKQERQIATKQHTPTVDGSSQNSANGDKTKDTPTTYAKRTGL